MALEDWKVSFTECVPPLLPSEALLLGTSSYINHQETEDYGACLSHITFSSDSAETAGFLCEGKSSSL